MEKEKIVGMKMMCAGKHQEGSNKAWGWGFMLLLLRTILAYMWASEFENNHSHSLVL